MIEQNKGNEVTAVTANYTSVHQQISERMSIFERTHQWSPHSREIDVFGQCWSIAWPSFSDNQVALHRLGQKYFLNGPLAVFIPPFSLIDVEIIGGEISWQAIISDLPIDNWAPTEATVYQRPANQLIPRTLEDIKKFIVESNPLENFVVEKLEEPTAIAFKFRKAINDSFLEDFTISELANQLGYNHAVIDRAFKKAYGISPINYRIKMRVMDSIHKLVLGDMKVKDVGYDVGFTTFRNFAKQFKKIMKISPSNFIGGQ
jgi:AraC-like DNA-binding protein